MSIDRRCLHALPVLLAMFSICACATTAEPGRGSASATQQAGRAVDFVCADEATFTVFYREDDRGDSLDDSEVMLRDGQTGKRYRLQRERSASGEKYRDASGLEFFTKGNEALLMRQGQRVYSNCVANQ